ncbi:MAG: BrnT family toxin [Bdellovibrionales bacterium]|nr:BrnT family toxin [Bdellovibrionales bacterium]
MYFTWDKKKAITNLKKHGVSFEEAKTCFFDTLHIVISDHEHSNESEERLILLGLSSENRMLVVVHIEYENNSTIRIISARKASKKERKQYEEIP